MRESWNTAWITRSLNYQTQTEPWLGATYYQEKHRWQVAACTVTTLVFSVVLLVVLNALASTDRQVSAFIPGCWIIHELNIQLEGTKATDISAKDEQEVWINRNYPTAQFEFGSFQIKRQLNRPTKNLKCVLIIISLNYRESTLSSFLSAFQGTVGKNENQAPKS